MTHILTRTGSEKKLTFSTLIVFSLETSNIFFLKLKDASGTKVLRTGILMSSAEEDENFPSVPDCELASPRNENVTWDRRFDVMFFFENSTEVEESETLHRADFTLDSELILEKNIRRHFMSFQSRTRKETVTSSDKGKKKGSSPRSNETRLRDAQLQPNDTPCGMLLCNRCGFPLFKTSSVIRGRFPNILASHVYSYEIDWLSGEKKEEPDVSRSPTLSTHATLNYHKGASPIVRKEPRVGSEEEPAAKENPIPPVWCYCSTNPFHQRFDVIRVHRRPPEAVGSIEDTTKGEPSGECSWFQPYVWSSCYCLVCSQHIGWTFTHPLNSTSDAFHGIILTSLVLRVFSSRAWDEVYASLETLKEAEKRYQETKRNLLKLIPQCELHRVNNAILHKLLYMEQNPLIRPRITALYQTLWSDIDSTSGSCSKIS